MDTEQARGLIATKFMTDWGVAFPTVEVFPEGVKEPDLTTQKTPFVMFKVGLPKTNQGTLAGRELLRSAGLVHLGLFVPMGQGTKVFFEMLDAITESLAIQDIGGVRMFEVTTRERQPAVGWQSREVLVNYSFDSIN